MFEVNSSYFVPDDSNRVTPSTKNKDATIILFYRPDCSHCREFIPLYEKLAKKLLFLKFVSVDAVKHNSLIDDLNEHDPDFIASFPSIYFYDGGKPKYKFVDPRTYENFISSVECAYSDSQNILMYK